MVCRPWLRACRSMPACAVAKTGLVARHENADDRTYVRTRWHKVETKLGCRGKNAFAHGGTDRPLTRCDAADRSD